MALLSRVSLFVIQHLHWLHPPDQDPLLPQLPLCVVLGADLEEEVHELLEWLRLARHDESDDVHEQTSLRVAIKHYGEDLLLRGCQTAGSTGRGSRNGMSAPWSRSSVRRCPSPEPA
jgi:hypothetical protein